MAYHIAGTKKGSIPVTVEKRPKGKCVTLISNIEGDSNAVLKDLQACIGTGGSEVRPGVVAIQGSHVDRVSRFLARKGCFKRVSEANLKPFLPKPSKPAAVVPAKKERAKPRHEKRAAPRPDPTDKAWCKCPCRGGWIYCDGECLKPDYVAIDPTIIWFAEEDPTTVQNDAPVSADSTYEEGGGPRPGDSALDAGLRLLGMLASALPTVLRQVKAKAQSKVAIRRAARQAQHDEEAAGRVEAWSAAQCRPQHGAGAGRPQPRAHRPAANQRTSSTGTRRGPSSRRGGARTAAARPGTTRKWGTHGPSRRGRGPSGGAPASRGRACASTWRPVAKLSDDECEIEYSEPSFEQDDEDYPDQAGRPKATLDLGALIGEYRPHVAPSRPPPGGSYGNELAQALLLSKKESEEEQFAREFAAALQASAEEAAWDDEQSARYEADLTWALSASAETVNIFAGAAGPSSVLCPVGCGNMIDIDDIGMHVDDCLSLAVLDEMQGLPAASSVAAVSPPSPQPFARPAAPARSAAGRPITRPTEPAKKAEELEGLFWGVDCSGQVSGKQCSSCGATLVRSSYSKSQWNKGDRTRRCVVCVADDGKPAPRLPPGASQHDVVDLSFPPGIRRAPERPRANQRNTHITVECPVGCGRTFSGSEAAAAHVDDCLTDQLLRNGA